MSTVHLVEQLPQVAAAELPATAHAPEASYSLDRFAFTFWLTCALLLGWLMGLDLFWWLF